MTYNVSWEAIKGVDTPRDSGVKGSNCPRNDKGESKCKDNILGFIFNEYLYGKLDFISLQEAKDINEYLSEDYDGVILPKKGKHTGNPILYDNNVWEILSTDWLFFHDDTEGGIARGRPITVCHFRTLDGTKDIKYINLHAPHDENYKYLDNKTYDLSGAPFPIIIGDDIDEVIITGDFNSGLKNSDLVFFGRQFYGRNIEDTCCDGTLQGNSSYINQVADHILSTSSNIKTQVIDPGPYYSDHLPIEAEIDF